jgi:glutamate-1-semialdehyde 2,1-aminomutase
MPAGVIKGEYWIPPYPFYIDRSEGCYLWDIDGRKIVDFTSHHTAMIIGHTPPHVLDAIQGEIKRGIGLSGPTIIETHIASEIINRVPSVDMVRFCNSGSEATQHAARLIRAYTGKPKIAKFEGAFQGSNDALEISYNPPLDKAGDSNRPASVPTQKGMPPNTEKNVIVLPYSNKTAVKKILTEHCEELAGIFYDAKPGMFDIPRDFHHFVRNLARDLGILFVMDEVISFCVGYGGYQGKYGLDADLTIFGKIVGGGFPVGAVGGRIDLMNTFDNSDSSNLTTMSGTFSGNNFTLAAGLATIRSLTPEIYDHIENLRLKLHTGLVSLFNERKIPFQAVSEGSVLSFYITNQPVIDYRSSLTSDIALLERIRLGLLLEGYYFRVGLVRTAISSPMTTEDVDNVLRAFKKVLTDQD